MEMNGNVHTLTHTPNFRFVKLWLASGWLFIKEILFLDSGCYTNWYNIIIAVYKLNLLGLQQSRAG